MPKGTLELDQSVLNELKLLAQGLNKSPEGLVTSLIQGLSRHRQDDLALMAEFEAGREGLALDEAADWMQP